MVAILYTFLVGYPRATPPPPPIPSELLIYFCKNALPFLSNIVGESFQCYPCCHSKKLNRWSLHVGYNNFYLSTFTGICCWIETCKELSEPEVVCTSPLRSGIGVSLLRDTVENWAKYASVAPWLLIDIHCHCMFVVMHPSTMLV